MRNDTLDWFFKGISLPQSFRLTRNMSRLLLLSMKKLVYQMGSRVASSFHFPPPHAVQASAPPPSKSMAKERIRRDGSDFHYIFFGKSLSIKAGGKPRCVHLFLKNPPPLQFLFLRLFALGRRRRLGDFFFGCIKMAAM